jgi:hypothetical protein
MRSRPPAQLPSMVMTYPMFNGPWLTGRFPRPSSAVARVSQWIGFGSASRAAMVFIFSALTEGTS